MALRLYSQIRKKLDDNDDGDNGDISLKKQQYVVNHTIRQTQTPVLPKNCITSPPSVTMQCPQIICFSLYFRKKSDKFQYWFRKGFVKFSVSPLKLCICRIKQICFMGRYVVWSMLVSSLVDENKPGHTCMYLLVKSTRSQPAYFQPPSEWYL